MGISSELIGAVEGQLWAGPRGDLEINVELSGPDAWEELHSLTFPSKLQTILEDQGQDFQPGTARFTHDTFIRVTALRWRGTSLIQTTRDWQLQDMTTAAPYINKEGS